MFYSLLKQDFSPVSPSKRASRISRSEVPACYLFSLHCVSGKSYPAASCLVAHPKRSGRCKREKDEGIKAWAKKTARHVSRVILGLTWVLQKPNARTGNNSASQHTQKSL